MSASPCTGCAQSQRRFRSTMPRLWCTRFHTPAVARCLDYRTKRGAIQTAINYLKRPSIK
jgi:hypothetical protein